MRWASMRLLLQKLSSDVGNETTGNETDPVSPTGMTPGMGNSNENVATTVLLQPVNKISPMPHPSRIILKKELIWFFNRIYFFKYMTSLTALVIFSTLGK